MFLNNVELDLFRKRFIAEKTAIETGEFALMEEIQAVRNAGADEGDQAQEEVSQTLKIQLRNREKLYLKKIEQALGRVEDKTYGDCESCGEFIGMKRLEARPTATLCISCKTLQEKDELRSVDGLKHKSQPQTIDLAR